MQWERIFEIVLGMARQLRVEYPGAIYHVTCRMVGDWQGDKTSLFKDDADRERFLERLGERVETAALGKPVIVGPNMENFRPVMADFLAAGAVLQVQDATALGAAVERLLGDPAARAEYARLGRNLVQSRAGVVKATVNLVAEYCPALFARP